MRRVEYRGGPAHVEVLPPDDGPDLSALPRRGVSSSQDALHYYWRLLYGRRFLLLAAALLGLGLSAAYTLRQVKLYTAQSTIEFKQSTPPGKEVVRFPRVESIPPTLATRLLTTKVLAARAVNSLRAQGVAYFDHAAVDPGTPSLSGTAWAAVVSRMRATVGGDEEREEPDDVNAPSEWEGVGLDVINAYYDHVGISPVRATSLADIVAVHPDPTTAARIANAHAKAFMDMDEQTRALSMSDANSYVRQQLEDVRTKLETSRQTLNDFQRENGILHLPKDNTTITRASLQQLNELLTKAQGERIVAEANYRNAQAMSPEALAGTLPDPGLQTMRDELSGLKAKHQANQREYGANHPDMAALRSRIAALDQRLREAGSQAREQMRTTLDAALAKEAELRQNFEKVSAAASNEDKLLVQMLILQRDVESNQELYNTLLSQAKEQDLLTNGFRWTGVNLVDRAVVPRVPTFPKTKRNLAMGLFLGLMAGAFGAILLDRLDTRIHTPEDIAEWLHLPSLGVIPDFQRVLQIPAYGKPALEAPAVGDGNGNEGGHGNGSGGGRQVVTVTNPGSVISEAYRSIRTNILFSSPGNPPKTVLVTSSQASEGKTVTTINLAVSLAMSGSNVCVIDADMRHPSCHQPLKVPSEPGLSNVLTGQCELADAVVRSPMLSGKNGDRSRFGLYVLPAGPPPPNPAELVGSAVMNEVLATLSENFDFVLVDSPPILPVTDSVVMATKTDGVVVVVKASEWGRDVVGKALSHLDAVRARVLGVVLNSVDVKRGGSSYYYYRHYHGGYYGYYGNSQQQA
ncbi:polysaccharide biosynthesis tyrosine autokinase [Candidatus Binatia bacterium]|nr:polysaccharide biosynthesis tyrosine autokinase [Candidatus Binatia bacterium]